MSQAVRKPFPRGVYGFRLLPKNIQSWQWVLRARTPWFLRRVKPKKDRLRVNCEAFFTWFGEGVGGLLGGDKAYRKLALKHHPDKMKRSMKVVLKVFIFWKLAFQFPGSPERPTGVLKAIFSGKAAPGIYSESAFHLP